MTARAVAKPTAARRHSTAEPAATHRRERGRPWPLGATLEAEGVNFAIFSSVAEKVELCLFDASGSRELERIALPCRTDDVWHGFIPGLKAGQRYGYRVHAPYAPETGVRCNPAKLMLDPYARAIDRVLHGAAWQYSYKLGSPERDLKVDTFDNGAIAGKAVVVDPSFDWEGDERPRIPMHDTVFYEVNVRGFTMQMEELPAEIRGTFSAVASPQAIGHFKRLGVTSIELLPVQAFNDERRLIDMGMVNYWGYNTVGFFAPEPRYCAGGDPNDFRRMVKALHAAGLEVIIDVVYNHTCEGNHLGPTLSFKGIDNAAYYRLAEDRRHMMDFTGTGNTLDASHPATLRLIMDSLRYWVEEMHVDGFRFDLAPAIARNGAGGFDHRSPFLTAVAQDPVLKKVKLIAEPWDVGPGGYQVGGFPGGWSEWNGRYRDTVRDFWRGADGAVADFAARLCGSADIYGPSRRSPCASVNLITVHDGFTLHDLVSYNQKHNESNAEDNQDGESHNRSWNCGFEGPTEKPEVLALREQQKRNLLATLLVSRGTPLLLGGDEMSRTQCGNNNAYCQDNPISWFEWNDKRRGDPLIGFVRRLIDLRHELPVLRADRWYTGEEDDEGRRDIGWFSVWGLPMTTEEWADPKVRVIAALLDGAFVPGGNSCDSVLLLFNASDEAVSFTMPQVPVAAGQWRVRLDTSEEDPFSGTVNVDAEDKYELAAHAMAILTQPVKVREHALQP
jgi:glycogen operon protein